ncbi:MAG TPA: formimidoylglutamate deiminase, partial [Emcibacteraceae bacterium]|nr:formimidoylglutamate deiminase [Emcibacteraceae bacterium]
GMPNLHSHAFQRAMAGLAEYTYSTNDSFWTWRDIMYRFAGQISSADLEVIASQLYLEMLKAGYVNVCEFHYLHHGGDDSLAMSDAIIKAAKNVGIALTHLPVLYMASGFGETSLTKSQLRFGHDIKSYLDLLSILSKKLETEPGQKLGMAFHSLRAVPEEALKECMLNSPISGPIHIHIAEQLKEVNDCLYWSGKRPVEWLYDHMNVDENWCLVHATHLNDDEISMIVKSGAVVGLCPTTEANLGDGLFPLKKYLDQNGLIAIGSDSHISVSISEELRWLEYGQRLHHNKRNIAADEKEPQTGTNLYQKCLKGGAAASGFNNGAIVVGKRADLIILDECSPILVGTPDKAIIDRFIFNGNQNPVRHVIVAGECIISDYKHTREDKIFTEFAATMDRLKKILD